MAAPTAPQNIQQQQQQQQEDGVYTYDDFLWFCAHVQPCQDTLALIKDALRPHAIARPPTAQVTSLLNKLTEQNCKKLTPALLNVIEADHGNGMKLLDHCCINVDRMAVFLDVLSLVTYKHELSSKFAAQLQVHVAALLAAWHSGDHADYDLFCALQKMQGSLRARMRILEMFVGRGLIPTTEMRALVGSALAALPEVELRIACLESVSRRFWPQEVLPDLLSLAPSLPFKLQFKVERLAAIKSVS